ncbi:MAG TPA: hypothetical protein DGG95_04275, partial [Cytophagales bacterium]|nr:hypothetical protein [Cytophagales bacterium]
SSGQNSVNTNADLVSNDMGSKDNQINSASSGNREFEPITDLNAYIEKLINNLDRSDALPINEEPPSYGPLEFYEKKQVQEHSDFQTNINGKFHHNFYPEKKFIQFNQAKIETIEFSTLETMFTNDEFLTEAGEAAFWERINKIREQINLSDTDTVSRQVEVQIFLGTSMTLTAGFVSWILRGGSLLASFLSTVPLFNRFDPLPILRTAHKNQTENQVDVSDEDGSGQLLDNAFKDNAD